MATNAATLQLKLTKLPCTGRLSSSQFLPSLKQQAPPTRSGRFLGTPLDPIPGTPVDAVDSSPQTDGFPTLLPSAPSCGAGSQFMLGFSTKSVVAPSTAAESSPDAAASGAVPSESGAKAGASNAVLAYGPPKKNGAKRGAQNPVLAYGPSKKSEAEAAAANTVLAYGPSKKSEAEAAVANTVLAYGPSKKNSADTVLAYGPHGSPKKWQVWIPTEESCAPSLVAESSKELARAAVLAKAKREAVPLKIRIAKEHLCETMQTLDPSLPVKKRPAFAEELELPAITLLRLDPHMPAKKTLPSFLLQESPCFARLVATAR